MHEVQLLIPEDDAVNPEVSIVIPALNEELTVRDFVGWCKAGLASAGVTGEVLIVDSSTDRTAELALAAGARVLKTPQAGLGRAYADALPYVRGRFMLMGDADCTYDFRVLTPFMEKFWQGFEFVMGSRFTGTIEPGSMPPLHRYLGTPVTTWILNFLFGSRFTDIHCGMRGITREAFTRLDLQSQSWEYASEMVLKSVHLQLKTAEVPVHFFKDRDGRLSHHRRAGWFSPWQAGWINLRAMFIHSADVFVLRPGMVLLLAGLMMTLPGTLGTVTLAGHTFTANVMLMGVTLASAGLHACYAGCLAQVLYDRSGRDRRRWLAIFPYTRTVAVSVFLLVLGFALAMPFFLGASGVHAAITGLLSALTGAATFVFTLLLHAVALKIRRPDDAR